jgi:hypothetical protein
VGRFFGPTPNIISGSGFFLGSALPPSGPTFMVVGGNTTNPNTANVPHASWRDSLGVWHVISTAAVGARALLGVTHVSGHWYATSNAPGGLHSLIGITADGDPPSALAAVPTGLTDPLSDIAYNAKFVIGSLFGNIITAPLSLASFASNPSHGPGSYAVQGVASNTGATSYVCVGSGSTGTGLCESADGITWANQSALFSSPPDSQVVSNTVIWDGTQFVSVSGAVVATSTNGLDPWTLHALNTTTATCISWDAVNGFYIVGDAAGSTLTSNFISGLATVTPVATGTSGSLRCVASAGGVSIFGDDQGNVFSTLNVGTTFTLENPGLGAAVLNSLSGNN